MSRPFAPNRFATVAVASLVFLVVAAVVAAGESSVRLKKQGDTIEVTIGGAPFATYHTSKESPKPFFSPVRSAGGAVITRPLENPEDHKHHKGVWVAIDEVNEIKYWAEDGKIENASVKLIQAEGNPARMQVTNHWLGPDGKPVLIETTEIAIHANRLMAYDIRFTPGSGPVTFDDTKEGLFGIRLCNSMREREGGSTVDDEGVKGTKALWGKEHKWIDYTGPIDGKTHGAALFDHPENPRKSRYHVRNYGLFTISPFGQKAYTGGASPANPLRLKTGETYRLRYGLYVHPGDTESADVAKVYASWVKGS